MTRLELLKILVGQARTNGFEFRRWYTTRLQLPWHSADKSLDALSQNRLYYALLFSHEFAQAFWKPGQPITFQVAAQTFERRMPDGSIATVQRKPYTRRSGRPDAWRYHLREMAIAEEPLRYMRRYLHIADDADFTAEPNQPAAAATEPASTTPATRRPPTPSPATLALARKAHERKQLALTTKLPASASKRGARVPGSRRSS